jgi:NADH-quinone oxidoreductase subunit J
VDHVIHPVVLYAALVVSAIGVAVALPRRTINPQIIGALIAAAGVGGVFLFLGLKARATEPESAPGLFFYVFAVLALGGALRVITHPRPVYAALYFIMTILASSALYLLMGAEFMAFALIIIYAGAIIITYLFVIMLATQAPTEEQEDKLAEYDSTSREPIAATLAGFVLLGTLTGLMGPAVRDLQPAGTLREREAVIAELPRKVINSLDRLGAFPGFDKPLVPDVADLIDTRTRRIRLVVSDPEALADAIRKNDVLRGMIPGDLFPLNADGTRDVPGAEAFRLGQVIEMDMPDELAADNIDGVGMALIAEHPMSLELAGVILLMAMLGAVVLARKQIEMGEDEKAQAARALARQDGGTA